MDGWTDGLTNWLTGLPYLDEGEIRDKKEERKKKGKRDGGRRS